MRFVLVTTGSSGDVAPFLALGVGLKKAGHWVRLAGPANAKAMCRSTGIDFVAIDRDQADRLRSDSRGILDKGNTLRFGLERVREKRNLLLEVNRAAWEACQGADSIIYRIGGFLAVDSIAEKLGISCYKAGLVPYTATVEFPSLYVYRGFNLGKAGNRVSYTVGEQVIWQFFRQPINTFRQNVLGLKPYPVKGPGKSDFSNSLPVIYGFSPSILPRPRDWPDNVQVTGHWAVNIDDDWQPPQGLMEYLQAGPPPVYIGFGSMVSQDPKETHQLILEALKICGQRAVLAIGWGGVQGLGDKSGMIYQIEGAPHGWLFPRVALAVHHGGIGTTTANLKAGIPAVIVPHNYDQPFWGQRVARLGVGTKPIPRKILTPERLANAIQRCLSDEGIRHRAIEIGKLIASENGVTESIKIIENL